ncbi:MAG: YggS family pyridoxal phosphate-dependent enzyme [Chitinophagaceae bacterium]|nr:YggS family pyridoxal phosphate-dependent enzyme [Chitinophagaceae bacterium]MBP8244362.1 YggS family pyridoxal phosphate-dependent enzyme [Chitinophagaceae bacterium]
MGIQIDNYRRILKELGSSVTLVAVSKTKPVSDIRALYDAGQRDFGENYVQELLEKAPQLPADIRWHFIGHLQTNKVKLILPVVQLIHGVDSLKLLKEINKQAAKTGKPVDCLLQVHIAQEETKFGLDETELREVLKTVRTEGMDHVRICGLMGMASFSTDTSLLVKEFRQLRQLFDSCKELAPAGNHFQQLSMGMSSDYRLAIEEGSTMLRIGSLLFGEREQK